MAIYPHPDDETMGSAGLLMMAREMGWITVVIILTQGGAGQMHIHGNGRSTKQIRVRELKKAAKILGVNELVIGDFDDGKLKMQKYEWTRWVEGEMCRIRPGWVVTYDPSGISGHPDHISLSVGLRDVNAKLWWTTVTGGMERVVNKKVLKYLTKPTHVLNLGWRWVNKWRAVRTHRSQALGKSLPIPMWLALAVYHHEWYHEVDRRNKYPFKYIDFKI